MKRILYGPSLTTDKELKMLAKNIRKKDNDAVAIKRKMSMNKANNK